MSSDLNPEQQRAVHHVEGPALVIAGAGSGKTRVITYRIAYLLSLGIPSSSILGLTFTNKAAEEMKERVEKISKQWVLISTFHSLGAKILRESIHHLGYQNDFTIYDEDDSEKLLKECLVALNVAVDKPFLKKARSCISSLKNGMILIEELRREDPTVVSLYELYQKQLKECCAVDFDDLLYLPIELFKTCPNVLKAYQERWSFILIDEYQDTNESQNRLIQLLSAHHQNVFAVGDPDQSIYSWRGARIDNILNFERDFPGAIMITLEQNYRSTSNILNASNALIQNNPDRYEKKLWSNLGTGDKIGIFAAESDREEAQFVVHKIIDYHAQLPLRECVIFYRTNFQSRTFEDALLKFKIPYVMIGGVSFYERREIKDILALLRMVITRSDLIAFTRTINLPKRGLGEKAVKKMIEGAKETNLPLFDYCLHIVQGSPHINSKMSSKQLEGLREYVMLILKLQEMTRQKISLHKIISEAFEKSRYDEYLKEEPETASERKSNVGELITKAAEWEDDHPQGTLAQFLEEITLQTSTDKKEHSSDAVRLMTLHNSKGLEFSLVFLVGMEEDLFPHVNSKEDESCLQEERRLCYVGMTRAKQYLYLVSAKHRFLWGESRRMTPSRFLSEIPTEYIEDLSPQKASPSFVDSGDFTVGDIVHHRDYGLGTIQRVYETSLGLTYDVFFNYSSRVHSLVARYAKLVKSSYDAFD